MRGRLAWAAFALAYLTVYFLAWAYPLRLLWYYPLEHRWAFEVNPNGLAVDYYGRVLASAVAGVLAAVAAGRLGVRVSPENSRRAFWQLVIWSVVTVIFTMGLVTSTLARRHPIPLALPAPRAQP